MVTFKVPLINCEINLILTWSAYCVISEGDRETTFAITDTKLYVPVFNLSTQDNKKLQQQLKSGFRCTINWNKYQSKVAIREPNQYLDYLIDPSFQGVNRLFVFPFKKKCTPNESHRVFSSKGRIRNYNIMIDGPNFLINR